MNGNENIADNNVYRLLCVLENLKAVPVSRETPCMASAGIFEKISKDEFFLLSKREVIIEGESNSPSNSKNIYEIFVAVARTVAVFFNLELSHLNFS